MNRPSPLVRYGVSVLATAAAMLLRWPLWDVLQGEMAFLFLWPVVIFSAWYGGLGPDLLATALSALAAAVFLLEPRWSVAVARPADLVGLAVFVLVNAAVSVLCEKLHRSRQSAERQREWLRVSLTSIGDAVIATDREARVTFLNPAAEALTGWGRRESRGRPLDDVFPIINEGTRQPVEHPVARVIREGVVVGLANHTVLVARDGTERPIEDSAAPIRADDGGIVGVILVFHDVSERRKQARALEERTAELTVAKAHLEAVFNSVGEGVAVFDQDANVVYCNDAEARMAGFTCPEEMRRNLSYFAEVFELSDAAGKLVPVGQWPVSRVLRGEAFSEWECHGRRKDTNQEWDFSFSGSPVRDADCRQVLSVIVTRDVTSRKAAERALRESEEQFRTSFELAAVGKVQIDPATGRFLRLRRRRGPAQDPRGRVRRPPDQARRPGQAARTAGRFVTTYIVQDRDEASELRQQFLDHPPNQVADGVELVRRQLVRVGDLPVLTPPGDHQQALVAASRKRRPTWVTPA